MSRLFVQVEGPTEENFVNEVLRDHLVRNHGFSHVAAKLMGNARLRDNRGGVRGWPEVRKEIVARLQEDKGRFVTTLVDYYGLPRQTAAGAPNYKAWPGRTEAGLLPFAQKAQTVQTALYADIAIALPDYRDHRRFIPFVVMHEFEGLLFSDPEGLARGVGQTELLPDFAAVAAKFANPEEINDSPLTAPSKRIQDIFDQHQVGHYEKPLFGTLAVLTIGLATIRNKCPHFARWLGTIEKLGKV